MSTVEESEIGRSKPQLNCGSKNNVNYIDLLTDMLNVIYLKSIIYFRVGSKRRMR